MSETEDFAAMFEASLKAKRIEKGQTIEGTIVAIGPEVAFVDVGSKGEATIEIDELKDADGDLEIALVVLQLVDLDRGFALAADVDKRHLRADRDDRAFDGLTPVDALRLVRSLEHRGKILLGFAHGTLLAMIIRGS